MTGQASPERGRTIVVKFGGNAMTSPELFESLARDISHAHDVGYNVVLCHGGGPQISQMLKSLDIKSEFKGGLRVTSLEVLEVVASVLNGEVNRKLVSALNNFGVRAVGIFGDDDHTYIARRKEFFDPSQDLGLVGEIAHVNVNLVKILLESALVPVVSPVSSDSFGQTLNVNADSAAGALAAALDADELVLMTDVSGVYSNWPDETSLVNSMNLAEVAALIPQVSEGMIPKLMASRDAVEGGARKVRIINGSNAHALRDHVLGNVQGGTVITP